MSSFVMSLPSNFIRKVLGFALAATVAFTSAGCQNSPPIAPAQFAPGASLSEDEATAKALHQSLTAFLEPLSRGEWNNAHSDPVERARYEFFYKSLMRGARDAEPVILKSYPVDDGAYLVTVAFMIGAPDAIKFSRIVEFEALPTTTGYQFQTPYERNIATFNKRTVGDITYRFNGPFNEAGAARFARFKTKLDQLQDVNPSPLQYDCFKDLDELLKTFGLIHDASKCNFLRHDLGFLWDDGRRFSTGTGDEAYIFGYVSGILPTRAQSPDDFYRPYVNGVAAYFGGYAMSGDSMEVLAQQFREELQRRHEIDFLEEFDKGRGSSVNRHFSHYVMCAFLCQEIVSQHGEAAALSLVNSGANGERFFDELESLIGVTRKNFHATILRLIQA